MTPLEDRTEVTSGGVGVKSRHDGRAADRVECVADIRADGDDLRITNVFIKQSLDSQHGTFHTGFHTQSELDSVIEDFGQIDSLEGEDT